LTTQTISIDLKLSNGNIYCRNHSINIKTFVKKLLSKDYKDFENIELYEEIFYDKCHNGGLAYHKYGIYEHIATYDKKCFILVLWVVNILNFLFQKVKYVIFGKFQKIALFMEYIILSRIK